MELDDQGRPFDEEDLPLPPEEDEPDFEGGEDAACGRPCGQEPMGCGNCPEVGTARESWQDNRFDPRDGW